MKPEREKYGQIRRKRAARGAALILTLPPRRVIMVRSMEENSRSGAGVSALGTAPVGRMVAKLAIPAVVAQIINLLYNLVDRMYVGSIEGIGTDALAGLGVALPITLIVSAFSNLVGMGGAPLPRRKTRRKGGARL